MVNKRPLCRFGFAGGGVLGLAKNFKLGYYIGTDWAQVCANGFCCWARVLDTSIGISKRRLFDFIQLLWAFHT